MTRLLARLLAASLLLAGCAPQAAVTDAQAALDAVQATATTETQTITSDTAIPLVLSAREGIEGIAAELPSQPATAGRSGLDPAAVEFVVRWEVGSEAQYVRKYQGVICPGGASGPTIGIGYDLGTQTPADIRAAWGWHPDVDRMTTASGQVGTERCAAWRAGHRDILVGYDDAMRVFASHDWPRYTAMASRAYRNGWSVLTPHHQGGLTSNGYNRGFTFIGSRRTEMREIRDTCVPGNDAPCTADQLRASCRVWAGTKNYDGLCGRRKAEAYFSLQR